MVWFKSYLGLLQVLSTPSPTEVTQRGVFESQTKLKVWMDIFNLTFRLLFLMDLLDHPTDHIVLY